MLDWSLVLPAYGNMGGTHPLAVAHGILSARHEMAIALMLVMRVF